MSLLKTENSYHLADCNIKLTLLPLSEYAICMNAPLIIDSLKKKGFRFLTKEELEIFSAFHMPTGYESKFIIILDKNPPCQGKFDILRINGKEIYFEKNWYFSFDWREGIFNQPGSSEQNIYFAVTSIL